MVIDYFRLSLTQHVYNFSASTTTAHYFLYSELKSGPFCNNVNAVKSGGSILCSSTVTNDVSITKSGVHADDGR